MQFSKSMQEAAWADGGASRSPSAVNQRNLAPSSALPSGTHRGGFRANRAGRREEVGPLNHWHEFPPPRSGIKVAQISVKRLPLTGSFLNHSSSIKKSLLLLIGICHTELAHFNAVKAISCLLYIILRWCRWRCFPFFSSDIKWNRKYLFFLKIYKVPKNKQ